MSTSDPPAEQMRDEDDPSMRREMHRLHRESLMTMKVLLQELAGLRGEVARLGRGITDLGRRIEDKESLILAEVRQAEAKDDAVIAEIKRAEAGEEAILAHTQRLEMLISTLDAGLAATAFGAAVPPADPTEWTELVED